MASNDIVAQLLRVEIFQGLDSLQLEAIARRAERMKFRVGDKITENGLDADSALLIVGGAAEWIGGAGAGVDADDIEIGSLIGEMAMFIDYVYGATIVAKSPVKCLKLTREAMHELMIDDQGLAEFLTAKIAQRLTSLAADLQDIDRDFENALPELAFEPGGLDATPEAATALN